jgi:hypothetical protein
MPFEQSSVSRSPTQVDLHSDIRQRLVESALRATSLDASRMRALPPSLNLFVWQNVLMELGGGFALSGDRRLLRHGQDLLLDLTRGGWVASNFPEEIHRAFVLNGMAVFLEHTRPYWRTDVLSEVNDLIARIAGELYRESSEHEWGKDIRQRNAWNHAAVTFSAIGTAGVILPRHSCSDRWRQIGIERIVSFFRHGVTDAGMTREGLAYCGFVFRNLAVTLEIARTRNFWDYQSDRDNPHRAKLSQIPEWYEAEVFPGGSLLQNWNDSYWDPRPALRGFLTSFANLSPSTTARVWNRLVGPDGDMSYGADNRFLWSCLYESALYPPELAHLTQPSPEGAFACRDVGYVVDTHAAGVHASKFSFNCGEFFGGIHDQGDNNSFTLFLDGFPCVLDSGAANRREEGSVSSTFGHNGIVINQKGQLPSGGGAGCSGQLIAIDVRTDHSFFSGDATRAYGSNGYNPVEHARRSCFFVKTDRCYAVIVDDIVKDEHLHKYSALLHTPLLTDSMIDTPSGTVTGVIDYAGRRTRLAIRVVHPQLEAIDCDIIATPDQRPFERHARWSFSFTADTGMIATVIHLIDIDDASGRDVSQHDVAVLADHVRLGLRWPATGQRHEFLIASDGKTGVMKSGV